MAAMAGATPCDGAQRGAVAGVARRRRAQRQRKESRHVDWLLGLVQARKSHHTDPGDNANERIRNLEKFVADLQAKLLEVSCWAHLWQEAPGGWSTSDWYGNDDEGRAGAEKDKGNASKEAEEQQVIQAARAAQLHNLAGQAEPHLVGMVKGEGKADKQEPEVQQQNLQPQAGAGQLPDDVDVDDLPTETVEETEAVLYKVKKQVADIFASEEPPADKEDVAYLMNKDLLTQQEGAQQKEFVVLLEQKDALQRAADERAHAELSDEAKSDTQTLHKESKLKFADLVGRKAPRRGLSTAEYIAALPADLRKQHEENVRENERLQREGQWTHHAGWDNIHWSQRCINHWTWT